MNPTHFDTFVKPLAARRSRRAALATGSAGLALCALGGVGTRAQDASPVAGEGSEELLFVQTFASGVWGPKAGEEDVFELTLSGVPEQTLYFADRPARDAGTLATDAFLETFGFDADNPPNAALVAISDGGEEVLVVELLNPRLDTAADTLVYDARPLAEYVGELLTGLSLRQTDQELPITFGPASLFIDAKNVQAQGGCPSIPVHCKGGRGQMLGPLGRYDGCYPGFPAVCCTPCHASQQQLNRDCQQKYNDPNAIGWYCCSGGSRHKC